jgi:hypothetical protein
MNNTFALLRMAAESGVTCSLEQPVQSTMLHTRVVIPTHSAAEPFQISVKLTQIISSGSVCSVYFPNSFDQCLRKVVTAICHCGSWAGLPGPVCADWKWKVPHKQGPVHVTYRETKHIAIWHGKSCRTKTTAICRHTKVGSVSARSTTLPTIVNGACLTENALLWFLGRTDGRYRTVIKKGG